jgi:hypothetical protein
MLFVTESDPDQPRKSRIKIGRKLLSDQPKIKPYRRLKTALRSGFAYRKKSFLKKIAAKSSKLDKI